MRETVAILRNRNMALLLLGRLISTGGDWLYQIGIMLAIFQYSHGESFYIGLFWLIRLVPGLVLGPVAGALADRMGYRKAMIAADIERLFLVVILALALHPSTWGVIYPIAFGVACGAKLFNPASTGLIPALVSSSSERLGANAAIEQVTALAVIAGSAAGGLGGAAGYQALLLIDAATFAVSAVCLLLLRPRPGREEAARSAVVAEESEEESTGIMAGLRLITGQPVLLFTALVMSLPELASGAIVVWIVPYASQVLHLASSDAGYLYAAFGIGSLLGGFAASALGAGIRLDYLLAGGIALGGLALALFGSIAIFLSALVWILILGLAETVEYAAFATLLQQVVPEDAIGRVDGTMNSYLYNMMLIGNIGGGLLASWIGLQLSIGALGIAIVVVTVGGLAYLRATTAGRPNALELARVPAFADVPFAVREWAVRRMAREDFAPNDVVILQGEEGDRFYTIAKGRAEVEAGAGAEMVRRELGPGDFFGEIALLQHVSRTATVRAETPLTVWTLGREDFEELQARAAEFKESLLETASARLAASPNLQVPLATRA